MWTGTPVIICIGPADPDAMGQWTCPLFLWRADRYSGNRPSHTRSAHGCARMNHVTDRPYSDPATAARKLLETANATEAIQDSRIHIEKIDGPMLFKEGASPAEYGAGFTLCDRQGLAVAAEVRDLREVHPCRRPTVRLTDINANLPKARPGSKPA